MEGEIQMDNSYFDSLAVVLPEDIEKLKWRGEFDRAVRRIDSRLEKDIPQALRKRLMIERRFLSGCRDSTPIHGQRPLAYCGTM